jgi:hypothetical protein
VTFRGPNGRWSVYLNDPSAAVTLPFPPEGQADLAADAEVRVEAMRLVDGVGLRDLAQPGGPGDLTDLDRHLEGFGRATP